MNGASVAVCNLGIALTSRPILSKVSFEVSPGEILAVIGPSGIGKSTLLRALAGLVSAREGDVSVRNGAERGRIAVVFQEPRLLPWLRVADNVAFVLQGPRQQRKGRASAALASVRLQDSEGAWPRQLSGGMAQRAALARALATAPHLLLLDEPFASVDALTRMELQEYVAALWREHEFTVVLVTHDIDEALYLADRILVLGGDPASVHAELEVPIPRPRSRTNPQMLALREPLLRTLAETLSPPTP
ncbi:MAG: hypothetical protein AUH31_00190 [Armatimonadetes bacterium 13_1_40CM_64_14]|nr:MAG: hypothetical protein AUH31_00190 [Armatimonadetes bacterium 13_1_40CM_64_14]